FSRLLDIFCGHCGATVLTYQKDGPGSLKRLYLDRIFGPANLAGYQKLAISKVPPLACGQCQKILGIPYVYPKEKRSAFRLLPAAVTKKIVKK
ncbi:MAG: hypothetical protein Q8O49_01460, partial [bacterium]|nr:hypothetical protein [bacterium]